MKRVSSARAAASLFALADVAQATDPTEPK